MMKKAIITCITLAIMALWTVPASAEETEHYGGEWSATDSSDGLWEINSDGSLRLGRISSVSELNYLWYLNDTELSRGDFTLEVKVAVPDESLYGESYPSSVVAFACDEGMWWSNGIALLLTNYTALDGIGEAIPELFDCTSGAAIAVTPEHPYTDYDVKTGENALNDVSVKSENGVYTVTVNGMTYVTDYAPAEAERAGTGVAIGVNGVPTQNGASLSVFKNFRLDDYTAFASPLYGPADVDIGMIVSFMCLAAANIVLVAFYREKQ